MTSSFLLAKKLKDPTWWIPVLPGATLGGMEDSYLRPFGECHPDFEAHPIGNPYGVKLCTRKLGSCTSGGSQMRIGQSEVEKQEINGRKLNGYFRGSTNLYNPTQQYPTQQWNPQFYSDRRTPWEQDLLRADYLRWPTRYNGTGMELMHAPAELGDTGHPYYQYGYSATPQEEREFGLRTATSPSQNLPEVKYDVTRAQQPYPLWKKEQAYLGQNQNHHDGTHFTRIVG